MNNNELAKEFLVKLGIAVFCLVRAYATVYILIILFPLLSKAIRMVLFVILILFEVICRIAFSDGKNDDKETLNMIAYSITTCFATVIFAYAVAYYIQNITLVI